MPETPSKKLLLLGGPGAPADVLAPLLSQHFEVLTPASQDASEAMCRPDIAAVLASANNFALLQRDMATRQSSLVLNSIGEGVGLCDGEGSVLWASDRFRELDLSLGGRIAGACRAIGARVQAGDAAATLRADVASDDGSRFYEVAATPIVWDGAEAAVDGRRPEGGHAELITTVVWDVTAARVAQHRLEAIDEAGRNLLSLDSDAIKRLNAAERVDFLQEQITESARRLLNFDHFTVRLLDRETGELPLVMAVGLPQEWEAPQLRAAREGNGIIGYVAATGRSYVCPDTHADPLYRRGLTQARSSLTLPLKTHDRIIGVLNVESGSMGAFSEDDRRFGEIFARSVAMALQILDLLVVERSTTNEAVSGRFEGEVREPLEDLAVEAEWLRRQGPADQEFARHIERILKDVESIKRRVRDVARGPKTILGADRALQEGALDPLLEGKRVLVADDEPSIRETIRDVLATRGCIVHVHPDGASAVAMLEDSGRARAAGDGGAGFDLVISDIKMPDRNGYEVFLAAKQLDPTLPVILMTGFGYDPHHSIVRASQEGLQCVLFKPFQVERLLDEVRKAMTTAR